MTSSKAIFLKDTELVKWWVGVVHDHRFDKIATYTRASIMEQRLNGDQINGVQMALSEIQTIIDAEAPFFDINDANPGMNHNLTHERQLDTAPQVKED